MFTTTRFSVSIVNRVNVMELDECALFFIKIHQHENCQNDNNYVFYLRINVHFIINWKLFDVVGNDNFIIII